MATLLDLMRDPDETPSTLEATTPSLGAANALAARLAHLSTVHETRTLSDFVPGDQTEKLSAISDASTLLDLSLNPIATDPPPTDAEVIDRPPADRSLHDLRGLEQQRLRRWGPRPEPAKRTGEFAWTGSPPRRRPCARACRRY